MGLLTLVAKFSGHVLYLGESIVSQREAPDAIIPLLALLPTSTGAAALLILLAAATRAGVVSSYFFS